jgi:CDGSH-type Zn-finger protein/uncharacterized Fe-S cluster protein YjdI
MAKGREHLYESDEITVRYNLQRCIHAEACVQGLPAVFDRTRRVWIDPTAASAEAIAGVIMRCPTGALHFTRKDGGPAEPIPAENTIRVAPNGPLYVQGNLHIETPGGEVLLADTRAALCRCGASHHKPLCDDSHTTSGFQDAGVRAADSLAATEPPAVLTIIPTTNGMFHLRGPLSIYGADGTLIFRGNEAWLCRCGHSQNKPFCDDSHLRVGFRDPETPAPTQ